MKKFLSVIWIIIKVLFYLIAFPIMIFYAIIRGFTEDNLKEKEIVTRATVVMGFKVFLLLKAQVLGSK